MLRIDDIKPVIAKYMNDDRYKGVILPLFHQPYFFNDINVSENKIVFYLKQE